MISSTTAWEHCFNGTLTQQNRVGVERESVNVLPAIVRFVLVIFSFSLSQGDTYHFCRCRLKGRTLDTADLNGSRNGEEKMNE